MSESDSPLNLTRHQLARIDTLAEASRVCRVVGYERYDETLICPIVRFSNGDTALLWPNGRLRNQAREGT